MKRIVLSALSFGSAAGLSNAATTLPVGPLVFTNATNLADYDNNFKEGTSGAIGVGGDTLRVLGGTSGSAVYDTSVTPGSGGNGGTGGSDANNDLSNFTVTTTINFANRGTSSTAGYFMRLDNSEAGGYLAVVSLYDSGSPSHIRFDLYKNVGIDFVPTPTNSSVTGGGLYSSGGIDFTTAANTNYTFSVTANGSLFSFSLTNPTTSTTATASYDDAGTAITTGQTGVFLRAQTSSVASRMDNFQITAAVPEPGSLLLSAAAGGVLLARRRR